MTSSNQTNGDVQQKHEKTIADYVGDMVALESHIEEALDRQLTETQDDPEARAAVQRFHDMVKQHRDTLKAAQEQVGTPRATRSLLLVRRSWAKRPASSI